LPRPADKYQLVVGQNCGKYRLAAGAAFLHLLAVEVRAIGKVVHGSPLAILSFFVFCYGQLELLDRAIPKRGQLLEHRLGEFLKSRALYSVPELNLDFLAG
jgi:hypothetical protein